MKSRHEAFEKKLELPMIIISVAVIPVLFVEYTTTSPALATATWIANVLIWLAFVAEYALMMSVVPDKWAYTKRAWLDVVIIVLSPPIFMPEAMAGVRALRSLRSLRLFRAARAARIARVARLSRFVRLLAFAGRAVGGANRVLKKNSLHFVLLVTVVLIMVAGTVFFLIEGGGSTDSLLDGMWWAITTMTTVGYGDIAPETTGGRLLAIGVMVLGIGFMAILTANIAAWFVERDKGSSEDDIRREITALREEISALRMMLDPGVAATQETHSLGARQKRPQRNETRTE